jgi:hypothetical protein
MTINQQVLNVHQFNINDVAAFEHVIEILAYLQEFYSPDIEIVSPNHGDLVEIGELSRVRGILSFIIENRVVEVNP